jgi:hypothetical protein
MISFDDIDTWVAPLADVLLPLARGDIQCRLQAANPSYPDDARELFLCDTAYDSVIDSMLRLVRSTSVSAYHGTRLTAADLESIKANGLVPLNAASRSKRLRRALSVSPRWPEIADRLEKAIQLAGPQCPYGGREGQVHLTLSRAGLTEKFNQYLTRGADFDWHVASELLGEEGKELLTKDGEPYVIQVAVPGEAAVALRPFFAIEHMGARVEMSNIILAFLDAWCFRLAHPGYQSREIRLDCGMIFKSTVPVGWIRRIDPWIPRQQEALS